nr:hypothetical protein SPSIL_36180 [Sporomusa silvacetica DSM 10669]
MVKESLLNLMIEFCGEEKIEACGNNKYMVYFPFAEDDYWYNMILHFGDKCECLEPENVRSELIRQIENLLTMYNKSNG